MGYYTSYGLAIEGTTRQLKSPEELAEIAEKAARGELSIMQVKGMTHEYVAPNLDAIVNAVKEISDGYNPFEERTTWYSHEDDMRQVSKQFPNLLLVLSGEGEEPGDIWRKYFRNGLVQVCKAEVVFPEFDENLLK